MKMKKTSSLFITFILVAGIMISMTATDMLFPVVLGFADGETTEEGNSSYYYEPSSYKEAEPSSEPYSEEPSSEPYSEEPSSEPYNEPSSSYREPEESSTDAVSLEKKEDLISRVQQMIAGIPVTGKMDNHYEIISALREMDLNTLLDVLGGEDFTQEEVISRLSAYFDVHIGYTRAEEIANISVKILRPLYADLDKTTSYTDNRTEYEEYDIDNVIDRNEITVTFAAGGTKTFSPMELYEAFDKQDFLDIETDQGPDHLWTVGTHTLQLRFLGETFTQEIELVENPFVRMELTDDEPFTIRMFERNGNQTVLNFTDCSKVNNGKLYLSAAGYGWWLFDFSDGKTLTSGQLKSNDVSSCKWFQAVRSFFSSGAWIVALGGGDFEKFTPDNIDGYILWLFVDGFYERYTEKRFDIRTERVEEEQEKTTAAAPNGSNDGNTAQVAVKPGKGMQYPYTLKITLTATEAEMKDILSLWFADVSSFDLSLSDKYDPETGTWVYYKIVHGPSTDGGGFYSVGWRQIYDDYVCSCNECCRIGINKDGKLLYVRPLDMGKHSHTFGDWIDDRTDENAKIRYCTLCGAEEKVKEAGARVFTVSGVAAKDLLALAGAGAKLAKADGTALTGEEPVGSGMTLTKPDGTRLTVIIKGDNDGDGKVSSADARLALRRSVSLEQFSDWQTTASLVGDGEKVSSADARLILRASVKLETLPLA